MPQGLKTQLTALAAYVVLVLGCLGPLHPGEQVWGGEAHDTVNFLGTLEWQARAAAHGNPLPRHTRMMLFPEGGAIWPADLLGSTAVIPVVWLAGPLWAYNLLVLGNLVFACWAMFWLVRRLTAESWAALAAGAVYGLAPVILGHVHNGILEQLTGGWLPLFLGCLLALTDQAQRPRSPGRSVGLVLATALCWWASAVSSHWYHGVYACAMFGLLLLAQAPRVWRLPGYWLRHGAALLLFCALVLPVALVFITPYESASSLMRAMDAPTSQAPEVSADAAYLFAPRPPLRAGAETFLHLAYLGLVVPLAALVGLLRRGRRRALAGWLACAGLWLVLSLGPRLIYQGQAASEVSLPYAWLAWLVPLFSRMDFPYRCFLMVHLCLALALGLGLAGLWRSWRWRAPAALALVAAVLLETALRSGAPLPAPRLRLSARGPTTYLARSGEGGRLALLDLPLRLRPAESRRYAVNQLFHGRPIPYTSFVTARHPFAPGLARESLVINLLYLASRPHPAPPHIPLHWKIFDGRMGQRQQASTALACLRSGAPCPGLRDQLRRDGRRLTQLGLAHAVLHSELLRPGSPLPAICHALWGAPVQQRAGVAVYRLRSAAEQGKQEGDNL